MWRALIVLGLLCLAAYGAVWLANHPETVAVTWQGREYATSLSVGVVLFLALAAGLAGIILLVQLLVSLPSRIGQGAKRRKQNRGYAAVTRGIVAVGAGDVAAARRHAGEAERLLGHQPLALLLKAQAAQASGDRETAETAFREMTDSQATRVLGLRGLFLEARRRGDDASARLYAEEATRIAPAIGWAGDAVLEAHSADGDWRGAMAMIERRTSLGLIDRATSRRQRAVLHAADALAREDRDPEGALAAAQEAVRLAPDLVPAASLAGRLLARKGDLKKAAKVVETAWKAKPHPDLAGVYLNLRSGDSAADRLHRAETLARLSSWSAESRLAIGRAAIEAREFGRARETLRPLLEERPTVRACVMMAELERRDGNPGGAREWLARAARAPRDEAWIADGIVSEKWAPVSPVSGRLDAFRWETPPELLGPSALEDGFAQLVDEDGGEGPAGRAVTPPGAKGKEVTVEPTIIGPVDPAPAAPAEPRLEAGRVAGEVDVPTAPKPAPDPARAVAEPAKRVDTNGSGGERRPRGPAREPESVVFPVPHAPDDPGTGREPETPPRFGPAV